MNRKINILYLDNTSTFGGAINSLMYLLRGIDKNKFIPVVVTGQSESYLQKNFSDYVYYSVKLKLPWIENQIFKGLVSIPFVRKRNTLKKSISLFRQIYWTIFITIPESLKYYFIARKHHINIIHLNNMLGGQLAGIIAAKLMRVPCIAHLRDFEQEHVIPRTYAKLIDHHIAISTAIKDNLLRLGVPEDRISIIHDAIDIKDFDDNISADYLSCELQLSNNKKSFGIFGRIVEWKGIREFILAAQIVCKEVADARAYIIGGPSDGCQEYLNKTKELVKELGLEGKVIFTGYRNDVPALMKSMDVIVHASTRAEPFGMVLIEAMAMGKPVVSTRAGGPLDIVVDGQTGFLVEMGDSDDMAKKIVQLLLDSDLCKVMGQKGRQRVIRQFSKERYAQQVQEVYENVLGE